VTFSKTIRKAGFLVIDFTWKLFSQTGNIETYLLLKEMENDTIQQKQNKNEHEDISHDPQM